MTPIALVTVFGWLATIYTILCLLTDVHAWVVTSHLYSGIPCRRVRAMLALVSRSRIHYYLWSPIVPAATLLAFSLAGVSYPIIFTVSLFLFWAHIVLYQALPPSVLLLGTSRPETLALRHTLERGLYPYRVVVLLEPVASVTATHSLFTRNLFEWDNVRTLDGSWQISVFDLLESVPITVVDARVASQGVVEEIKRIFNNQLDSKTYFVSDHEGFSPALSRAQVQIRAISVICESQVTDTLKRSHLHYTTSPEDNQVLRNWSRR